MSSKFKSQNAGVFWPPKVCISKVAEALVPPIVGQTALVTHSGSGVGLLGPWEVNETIRLHRNANNQEFQSNIVPSSNGWFYQVLITPGAGVNPYTLHLAYFFNDQLSPAMWSGDRNMGNWSAGRPYDKRVTSWDVQFGSGQADARVWIY